MFKKLKRINTTKACYPVSVELRTIRFGSNKGPISLGQRIQIAYIKKGVVKSSSQLHEVTETPGGIVTVVMNDVIIIRATMYKDANGVLQEKALELTVRDKTGTEFGKFELKVNHDNINAANVKTLSLVGSGTNLFATIEVAFAVGTPSAAGADDDDSVMGDSDAGSVNGDTLVPSPRAVPLKARSASSHNVLEYAENESLRMKLEQALVDVDNANAKLKDTEREAATLRTQ
jgi:hypothetical protein